MQHLGWSRDDREDKDAVNGFLAWNIAVGLATMKMVAVGAACGVAWFVISRL